MFKKKNAEANEVKPPVTAIPNRFLGTDTMNSVGTKFNN